jgi:hypothetical protein
MAKLDGMEDVHVSKGVGLTIDKTKMKEAHLNRARARLAQASAHLYAISVARFGAAR